MSAFPSSLSCRGRFAPGLLLTRWHENTPAEQIAKINDSAALRREVKLEECAAMYIALLKNDNVTGQTITVDSGLVI